MFAVYLETGNNGQKRLIELKNSVSGVELMDILHQNFKISKDSFFLKCNGLLINEEDQIQNQDVILMPRLLGGKGGFGSMLRAIGAQIEKTTNREACRDLSGRRLRDINEEKRLKAWLEKQAQKKDDSEEKKKKKIEKLRAEPKHEFKDASYEAQRSELTERVQDAVEAGFAVASASIGVKRASESEPKRVVKKRKTILDDSDDDLSGENSSDEEETKTNKLSVSL
ncbi:hypothetical protein TKK_0008278 [Trichogramma kaykai]|uniref:SDE2-like domain-containing protein n=1 Tax=Trichogramma kaykai TaxID=54128 RepID=A0ABD2X5M3_9HYME